MNIQPTLLAYALLATLAAPVQARAQDADGELPLSGAAYRIAEQAYAAYARGDYVQAAEQAREAVRLRPDVARLHALLASAEQAARGAAPASVPGRPAAVERAPAVSPPPQPIDWNTRLHRLQAAGDWPQAWRTVERALAERPGDAGLRARRTDIGRQLATAALRRAWTAQVRGDAVATAAAVDEALGYAPGLPAAHLLRLRQVLLREGASQEALDAARTATAQAGTSADGWLALAGLLHAQGDPAAAQQALRDGLERVPAEARPRLHLALAEALLAEGRTGDARQLLQPSPANDAAAGEQRRLAAAIEAGRFDPALLRALPADVPQVGCGEDAFGIHCGVQPSAPLSHRLAAQAQRLASDRPQAALALFDAAALAAQDGDGSYRAQAAALRADQAYRALAADQPAQALAIIDALDAQGALPDTMLADAAYTALRLDARDRAEAWFRRSLDAADAGRVELAPQPRSQVRRALAELDRDRGFIASFSYRGDSTLAGLGGARLPGDNLQLGWEGYLRPQALQSQGRHVEFHARLTGNAWSQDGAATGGDSLQAAFGVRARPLRSQNLVLAVERLQHVGDAAIDDWLLRAAWSHSHGTDLRADVPAWWSSQLYAEAGRYLDHGWTYAIGEWQGGRSWHRGGGTMLTPHLAVVAEHNQAFSRADAFGAGPGLNLRQWFRQDHYLAPRSWLELSLQYRLRLGGDARAEGWFIRGTVNY
ncbi:tetratricopeptide repeat protein [Pseudoxanthomonas sp.]|uniref:NfrA family protein n=1 Tax=Pseudoxanthomonas sp. TaxID=1871049 RepID=UPI00258C09FE|nr:tetratricopeptide repeat protein [Pseudoxanthomonas sp.]MCR6686462.1 tetratricopeptide repeat protein [Pseudoxanthomonas sp.]